MSTYAIGDVQGCFSALTCLLKEINFNDNKDQLWLAGDVINRGGECLQVLRFLYERRDNVKLVLGNHDLHLLAVATGARPPNSSDTMDEILSAPDCETLLDWLRQQPLLHHERDTVMVHAGIAPQWTLQQAKDYASEVENALRGDTYSQFFATMYGNKPCRWNPKLKGFERLRVITNYFTRMRYVTRDGALDLNNKGPKPKPGSGDILPWFAHPGRLTAHHTIVFGHWASINGHTGIDNTIALDTGCVWGGALTAYNIDTRERVSCRCKSAKQTS